MEPKGKSELWQAISVLGVFFGIILGISASAWIYDQPDQQEINMTDVTCFANPSSFMVTDGWLRLWEVDRGRVTSLVSEGKAVLQREDSLICHDVRPGGGPYRVVVSEWWWRRI